MKIETKFNLREEVIIPAIAAAGEVKQIKVNGDGTFYQVDYRWGGKIKTAWLHETAVEK